MTGPMKRKKILFVFRRPPYHGNRCAELLDAAMMAAGFGQEVELAFLDDGVFLFSADPGAMPETMTSRLAELEDCDIEHIWVERQSLEERGLQPAAPWDLEVVDRTRLAQILAEADAVVSG